MATQPLTIVSRSNTSGGAHKRARVSTLNLNDPLDVHLHLRDDDLENGILSALLYKPEMYDAVAEILQPADFFNLQRGYIYHAMGEIIKANARPDQLTLITNLETCNAFTHHTRDQYVAAIMELLAAKGEPQNLVMMSRQLVERAARLRLIAAMQEVRDQALELTRPLSQVAAVAEQGIFNALARLPAQPSDMASHIAALKTALVDGVQTQKLLFPSLDEVIGGIGPREVAMLAGMTGSGKTTLALSILQRRAQAGKRDLFFSIEMPASSVLIALLSMCTGINRKVLEAGKFPPAIQAQVDKALEAMQAWRLEIIDEYKALTPGQLRHRVKRMLMRGDVDMIVVDGLWKMDTDQPVHSENEWARTKHITAALTTIAHELGVPILLVHQYNLKAIGRTEPDVDIMGGGAGPVQNVDILLALWKPRKAPTTTTKREVWVLKNRARGSVGYKTPIRYDASSNTYTEDVEATGDVSF